MPGLEFCMYIHMSLMHKYMPKLAKHMTEEGFIPQMYCSQWYMTLFSCYFPLELVVRIMDVYFVEGRKTIFRIGLAILKINES